ncbi:MAG: hypothetical protein R2705_03280 [Ilumatobacteraceae bacterium]
MQKRSRHSLVALPLVGLLTLAACGSDGDDAASTDTTAATETTAGGAGRLRPRRRDDRRPRGVCPETVVIQTDWNPRPSTASCTRCSATMPRSIPERWPFAAPSTPTRAPSTPG